MDAIERARRVGETMFAVDTASKDTMGMELLSCEPGRATVRMRVQKLHLNGHQICHGGFIFTLADTTFAFACNAYNELSVASGFDVNILASAQLGDVLTAQAQELSKGGRTGVYEVLEMTRPVVEAANQPDPAVFVEVATRALGGRALRHHAIELVKEGRTTVEELRYDSDMVRSVDWETYPILKFSEIPHLQVTLMAQPDQPWLGVGEGVTGPTAAALANAVHHALGVRVRDLPLTPERVIQAMP